MGGRAWPPYQTLQPLIHAHVGRPAVIIGAGESLPKFMPHAPPDAVFFSVNDHGARYFKHTAKTEQRCSYMVCLDSIERRVRFDVRPPGDGDRWGVPVICRYMFADYRLLFIPAPNSGMSAAWAARVMGCSPIILAGMDLYRGVTYHDHPEARSSGQNIPPAEHRGRWIKIATQWPAMYRMLGGDEVLRKTFGDYDPVEAIAPPVPAQQLLHELRRARVRITSDTTVFFRPFKRGEVLDLMEREVHSLFKIHKGAPMPLTD